MEKKMSDTEAAIEAGRLLAAKAGEPFEVRGTPCLLVPDNMELKSLDHLRHRPVRIAETVVAGNAQAFVDYFNRFKDADSVVFADIENHKFKGVIDYHQAAAGVCPNEPRYGAHVITYGCPLTKEAKAWLDNSGKAMNQTDFALFIEDNLPEILEPTGADMLEIATTLHATCNASFGSGIRLDNGQVNFRYQETIDGAAGTEGQLAIPKKLVIGVRLFEGDTEGYRIEANFRWRQSQGKLALSYELVRPHRALEDAVRQIRTNIADKLGTTPIIDAKF